MTSGSMQQESRVELDGTLAFLALWCSQLVLLLRGGHCDRFQWTRMARRSIWIRNTILALIVVHTRPTVISTPSSLEHIAHGWTHLRASRLCKYHNTVLEECSAPYLQRLRTTTEKQSPTKIRRRKRRTKKARLSQIVRDAPWLYSTMMLRNWIALFWTIDKLSWICAKETSFSAAIAANLPLQTINWTVDRAATGSDAGVTPTPAVHFAWGYFRSSLSESWCRSGSLHHLYTSTTNLNWYLIGLLYGKVHVSDGALEIRYGYAWHYLLYSEYSSVMHVMGVCLDLEVFARCLTYSNTTVRYLKSLIYY